MGYYAILDRGPKGRDEGDQPMSWLRRHDEYQQRVTWAGGDHGELGCGQATMQGKERTEW